ncbi:hypothetical protein BGW36DRAFT_358198 [Talaromyces proteolyticus]|uniref:NmrA-like domain-containing protein n=1 Tax=Talaromyces proteolyticus TaxID=1131652 RepID=A0AAD4KY58_9EURO|nr:uncharacterized protein BGW36DRAFT_358198 [Talaromyces proteolyticus]KAH8698676.1 hypothetical protein BGW36DRAFT_358198 [Talaromyces proteolyticus]
MKCSYENISHCSCRCSWIQGASVVSVYLSSQNATQHHIRALTSNPLSDAAVKLASNRNVTVMRVDLNSFDSIVSAFQDATFIFANTVVHTETFLNEGAKETQLLEERQAFGLVYSSRCAERHGRKIRDPAHPIQNSSRKFLLDVKNGLAQKTTYLYVGLYGSNIGRDPYRPIYVKGDKRYIITWPCSSNANVPYGDDKAVNIGLIVKAIKNSRKSVLGISEYLTSTSLTSKISRILKEKDYSADVAFVETTFDSYRDQV